ncbi:MAG: FkbM family methyltransferase [Nitrososphaerota archaeon]|nr:FkbM family methyltransferase [Nitrososphaerota archaeon]
MTTIDEVIVKRCYDGGKGLEIRSDSIVLDLGANIGIFTVLAAIQAVDGRVISVEPERDAFNDLNENIGANHFGNVEALNVAISDRTGTINLSLGQTPGEHTTIKQSSQPDKIEVCQAIEMKQLWRELHLNHVDFLKVDIEGAEFVVFRDSDWINCVDRVVMEVHPWAGDSERLLRDLRNHGFQVTTSRGYMKDAFYVYAVRKQ